MTKRSYGRFRIYQLISTANPALFEGIRAGLAVLISWYRSKTAHRICFSLLYFHFFLKYEIIVRTSAWSFVIQIPIQAVCANVIFRCKSTAKYHWSAIKIEAFSTALSLQKKIPKHTDTFDWAGWIKKILKRSKGMAGLFC